MGTKKDAENRFTRRVGWGNVAAIKNNNICSSLNSDILFRPGARIKTAVEMLYEVVTGNKGFSR